MVALRENGSRWFKMVQDGSKWFESGQEEQIIDRHLFFNFRKCQNTVTYNNLQRYTKFNFRIGSAEVTGSISVGSLCLNTLKIVVCGCFYFATKLQIDVIFSI